MDTPVPPPVPPSEEPRPDELEGSEQLRSQQIAEQKLDSKLAWICLALVAIIGGGLTGFYFGKHNTGWGNRSPVNTASKALAVYHIYDAFYGPPVNPSGVWSFGWKEQLEGDFVPFAAFGAPAGDNGVKVPTWSLTRIDPPSVTCNTNDQPSTGGRGTHSFPKNAVWFSPGGEGRPHNFGAIRFTAPPGADGPYQVVCAVDAVWKTAPYTGDADFHVVSRSTEIFGCFLPPVTGTGYTNILMLNGGDTLDFLIGRGADGKLYGACLYIDATVTRLPASAAPRP